MKLGTKERTALVRQYVQNFTKTPSRQLARMIYAKHKKAFLSYSTAYSAVRYARGAVGKVHRSRAGAKAGVTPKPIEIPPSIARPWDTFALGDGKHLIINDLHVPFHDPVALEVALEWGINSGCTTCFINGDLGDFFSISAYDKRPDRVAGGVKQEMRLQGEVLLMLAKHFERVVFKPGNHDEWLGRYIRKKAPELWGIESLKPENAIWQEVEELDPEKKLWKKIEFLPDLARVQAGKLTILHGHELPKGAIGPVNAARGVFIKAYDLCTVGHWHQHSNHTARTLNNEMLTCWSIACLCGLWPDYAKVNQWGHGAATVEVDGREFNLDNRRIYNGKLL